jgi:hypothetical protein
MPHYANSVSKGLKLMTNKSSYTTYTHNLNDIKEKKREKTTLPAISGAVPWTASIKANPLSPMFPLSPTTPENKKLNCTVHNHLKHHTSTKLRSIQKEYCKSKGKQNKSIQEDQCSEGPSGP